MATRSRHSDAHGGSPVRPGARGAGTAGDGPDAAPARRPADAAGKAGGTQAIGRAFAVLHLFSERGTDLGVAQVAKELGLTLSTAHRIIRALLSEGYLMQNEEGERYYLGRSALLLGQAAQRNFGLDVIRPVLQRLSDATGESVNLGVLDGDAAVIIQRVESPQPLRFSQSVGTRVILHASSMGKALLAFNPDLEQRIIQGKNLPKITPTTITTAAGLRAELAQIREQGWSKDDEESIPGVRCAGAPIVDSSGYAWSAIAVQAPAMRVPDARFAELGTEVVRAAKEIAGLVPPGHRF